MCGRVCVETGPADGGMVDGAGVMTDVLVVEGGMLEAGALSATLGVAPMLDVGGVTYVTDGSAALVETDPPKVDSGASTRGGLLPIGGASTRGGLPVVAGASASVVSGASTTGPSSEPKSSLGVGPDTVAPSSAKDPIEG